MTPPETQAPMAGSKMVDVFSDDQPPDDAITNPIGWELARLAEMDSRLVALAADMSRSVSDLREHHPDRYVELGIAETNAVSVAAGMAACGLRPYVLAMGPFGAIKCAEQIRMDLAFTGLPVRFVARLTGLAMGFFGPSHQAVEDIAITRAINGLTVTCPADANAIIGMLRSTYDHDGPVYVRVNERSTPVYETPPTFERGRWPRLREGGDVTLVGAGSGVGIAVAAAELLARDGIAAAVLDAAYLKPLDEQAIVAAAGTGPLLTIEEHNEIGGLGSAVCEVVARRGLGATVDVLALPDEELAAGVPALLLERYGLTADNAARRARALLDG
jgi:transketolase